MTIEAKIILAIIVCIFIAIFMGSARANGGDFFEEIALHGLQENPNMGSPYFGFVRDERGKGVNQAQVYFTYENTTKVVTTNILGHYTQDGFNKDIDAKNVNIGCKKTGYEQIRVERRQMTDRTLQPVEANCILRKI